MTAEALGNQILSYLDTHWATELDVVDRSVLAAGIALHLTRAGGVSSTAPDETDLAQALFRTLFDAGVSFNSGDLIPRLTATVLAAGFRRSREATTEPRRYIAADIERLCEVMHDAYEKAAAVEGWATQKASRKPWSVVPDENKRTMRYAVSVLLEAVEASRSPKPTEHTDGGRDE